jgi:hypothetical protein
MFSLEFYRWLHIVSLLMIFTGLTGLVAARVGGAGSNKKFDRSLALIHGVGMLGMLVAGFGAMARLGFMQGGWPWWIYVKLVIWLLMGGSMTLAKRKAQWGPALLLAWVLIAAVAAYLGIFKPATY